MLNLPIPAKLLIIEWSHLIILMILGAVFCFIVGYNHGSSDGESTIDALEDDIKEYRKKIREQKKLLKG